MEENKIGPSRMIPTWPDIIDARSVAAANVGHAPVVSADGHVAATVFAVVTIPTTMPVPPIVTVAVTTDAGRTDAELAARKHNRRVGRAQGTRKRGKSRETGRKQQDRSKRISEHHGRITNMDFYPSLATQASSIIP